MKPKVGILSLGCPRNLVDSESISGRLIKKGYRIVDIDKARIAIVNTCSFIKDAKEESIDVILDLINLKKEGKVKKVIVYGCLSERYKDILAKELPEVDAFVGRVLLDSDTQRFKITPRHYAYLKICEGCVNQCSFCVIPKIKGKFQSLPVESILKKVDILSREKVSELNIIGQDISGFGLDIKGKPFLPELLKFVVKRAHNIGWIKLLYLNPLRVDTNLLEVIAGEEKICKYIDLPLQHINNRILKMMNRGITKEGIFSVIEKIRKRIPGVFIRTSFIVGFPGETENEFKELLSFVKDLKFERLGVFKYSREEGTKAYDFKGHLSESIKNERFERIMQAQQQISTLVNSSFMNRKIKVLVDDVKEGEYIGRTEFDAPEVDGLVYIKSKRRISPGDFVEVLVTDTLEYDLVGQEV